MSTARTPAGALRRIAFLLERAREASYRVGAYRTAAAVVDGLGAEQLDLKIRTNTLKDLKGVGPKTAAVIVQAHKGQVPEYLASLEEAYDEQRRGGQHRQEQGEKDEAHRVGPRSGRRKDSRGGAAER